MNIDLKRFVDVNIKKHTSAAVIGTRDTVVLFTAEGTSSTPIDVISYSDAQSKCAGMATTLAYLKVYFDCGGVNARVIGNTQYASLTSDMISDLGNEYIVIAYAVPDANVEACYSALETLATTRAGTASIYGINEKLILARSETYADTTLVKNFCAKYSNVLGAEMSIAAYLSNINVYGVDTVYDYMFTAEAIDPETMTDANYETAITNNYNVNVRLAGANRNCGGNCKDGADLVNSFVRIVLHQTLTDVLLELLATKINDTTGISKITSVCSQELSKYVTCGYLTTNKTWTDNDLIVNYNSQSYTIIEKGTALVKGYLVRVLPFAALTDADRAAHKAPPVYVVIADQYGIRAITINGDVI